MQLLTTERLLIREATLEDDAFIFQLLNSPTWLEFIGDKNVKDLSTAQNYISDSLLKSYQTNGYGLYVMVLKKSEQAIGLSGFVKRDYLDHPDIGFAILPDFEGKGYSFEAADALVNYATENFNFSKLYAITSSQNLRSQNLLTKLGLKNSGTVRPPNGTEELLLFIKE